ncbi:MAG: HD-GYP domain-containing protein, partial [Lachnospiraceae bacterium]|nr:HD-GYP domain-containing protein [Lachnospiraceae bacterium]
YDESLEGPSMELDAATLMGTASAATVGADENKATSVIDDAKSSFSDRIKNSPEFREYKQEFDATVTEFKKSLNDIVEKNAPIDTDTLLTQATSLLDGKSTNADYFNMLHNMRNYDDLTFAHSMNVALITNILATWIGLNDEEIEIATLSGLLHDIGKLAIPDSIIKKPGKLTDEEYAIIKKHPYEGYKILQNQPINDHIKNAALMHHEKCDGTGYPLGLSGEKIDPYAKLVAIADVYDAMTAARVYRGPLCPFQAIELFEKEGLQKYEAKYIMTFLENVVMTYMNNRVRLSDGREGDIVFINKSMYSRPMLKSPDGAFIDLAKEPASVNIIQII